MRALVLALFATSLLACGEIADDAVDPTEAPATTEETGTTSSPQRSATDAPRSAAAPEPLTAAQRETNARFPPPTWGAPEGACLLSAGPPAPGECEVGEDRSCPDDVLEESGGATFGGCSQRCVNVDGAARWSQPSRPSMPGVCAYYDTNLYVGKGIPSCMCNTPLVLAYDDEAVRFRTDATGSFDLSRNGMSQGSDWPSAATPWLAFDRDGNGTIDDGGELFGSATRLASGAFARNGFEALRDLDDNQDGVFDAGDAAFARVLVWRDRNADRISAPNELSTLAEAGVRSIDLHDRRDLRCDARMNCEGERSRFTRTDGRQGTVIDVYLPTR